MDDSLLYPNNFFTSNIQCFLGGSPGLVVMGGDSRFKGRGFESRCHILDGHFFTLICCKIVRMFDGKRQKINEKVAGVGPFFKKNIQCSNLFILHLGLRHFRGCDDCRLRSGSKVIFFANFKLWKNSILTNYVSSNFWPMP